MSADDQGGAGRREVAYRLFAAEYDDADFQYSEDDEERAPNYVVTPTGARVNRLFAVGVLTEVESVSDDVLRGRVVDPTGAFVLYAGQYQPDAQSFLERAEPPLFVAVTGKARTYEPDDGDRVFTSVRPESVAEVDAGTRDRWTVQAAAHTLDRVATFAAALDRPERGDDLRAALVAAGVDVGLAAGIPLAIDHYGTTPDYLDALRRTAVQAAEVVADEREEVDPLELAPAEGGEASLDLDVELDAGMGIQAATAGESEPVATADADVAPAESAEPGPDEAGPSDAGAGTTGTASDDESQPDVGTPADADTEAEPEVQDTGEAEPEATSTATGDGEELGDFEDYGDEAVESDELYEFDEAEREEIEEEFGTEFATGNEVEEPGEADMETPAPEDADAAAASEPAEANEGDAGAEPASGADEPEAGAEPEPEAETGTADEAEAPAEDVDLEDAVVDAMRDLDEGDGADREAVIERVVEAHGASADDVEDAIQDALMGGKCYEPDDGRLKAI